MPFVKIDKQRQGAYSPHTGGIRMGVFTGSAGKDKRAKSLYFAFSEHTIAKAGWTVSQPNPNKYRRVVRLSLQEGVGEDAGFLMIVEDQNGYSYGTTSNSTSGMAMNISFSQVQHYVTTTDYSPSADVEFTVDEKEHTILIQCPDWLRYNSLSYTPPKTDPPVKEPPRAQPNPIKAANKGGSVRQTLNNVTVSDVARAIADDFPEHNRSDRRIIAAALTKSLR